MTRPNEIAVPNSGVAAQQQDAADARPRSPSPRSPDASSVGASALVKATARTLASRLAAFVAELSMLSLFAAEGLHLAHARDAFLQVGVHVADLGAALAEGLARLVGEPHVARIMNGTTARLSSA